MSVEASRYRILRDLQNSSERDLLCIYRRFIPRNSIRNILTRNKVDTHLRLLLSNTDLSAHLAAEIAPEKKEKCHCQKDTCTGRRIIFASLLQIGREDYIQCIIDQSSTKFCDSTLPLKVDTSSQIQHNGHQQLTEKDWQLLENAQWQIRAHYLSALGANAEETTKLDDGAVLPLKEMDSITDQTNESRKLSRIKIHPDHHQLTGGSNTFILKTFRDSYFPDSAKSDFEAELQANRQAPRHERIVPLLAAFEFSNEFHLIFPYANGGDLNSLWKKFDVLGARSDTRWYSPGWLLAECLGISKALAAIHQPDSHDSTDQVKVPQLHLDIKSKNILCFRNDQGSFSLKLADFGISRKARHDLTLGITGNSAHTNTYRSPEYDTEDHIRLNYDVWGLGCLYLEFITWAIAGYGAIYEFTQSRIGEKSDSRTSNAKGEDFEDTFFKKSARPPRWYDPSGLRVRVWNQSTETVTKKATRSQRSFQVSRGEIKVSCEIKDSVKQHISTLRTNERCNPEFRDFLNLIETKMLVVDMEQRANSYEVTKLLQDLNNRYRN